MLMLQTGEGDGQISGCGGLGQRNELLPYRRETLPPSVGINQPKGPRRSFLAPYKTKSRRQRELLQADVKHLPGAGGGQQVGDVGHSSNRELL